MEGAGVVDSFLMVRQVPLTGGTPLKMEGKEEEAAIPIQLVGVVLEVVVVLVVIQVEEEVVSMEVILGRRELEPTPATTGVEKAVVHM